MIKFIEVTNKDDSTKLLFNVDCIKHVQFQADGRVFLVTKGLIKNKQEFSYEVAESYDELMLKLGDFVL